MTNITFTREEDGRHGRFVAHVQGHSDTGEMTYTRRGPDRISLDHTGVPDSLGGLGVGKALALHVIETARAEGFTVIPICPYFKAQVAKHPEWADVIADARPR